MSNKSKLDTEKSIKTKKTPLTGDFLDKIISFLSSFIFVFVCMVSIVGGICIISTLKVEGEFTGFLIYILSPLLMIFGIYGIYRVWKNRILIRITTTLTEMENKALLIDFLQQRKYHIVSQSKNSIHVIEEESMSVNDLWTKHFRFILNDNEILFNIQKHYPVLNPPVFFTHILLRHDLKSFIIKRTKAR